MTPRICMDESVDERREWQRNARRVLEELSHLRIDPGRLTTLKPSVYRGGKSAVALASLHSETGKEAIVGPRISAVDVAVKEIYFYGRSDRQNDYNEFAHEIRTLSEISHPNVVHLIGFLEDEENQTGCLVFPWEPNGNVREFVASGEWEIPECISLIKDIMSGIDYLHSREPPILHNDLKSLNILVNSGNHAFITDFGSARKIRRGSASETKVPTVDEILSRANSTEHTLEQPRVEYSAATQTLTLETPAYTTRWAAPEVLFNTFDLPGDIWAFAWVCWEIMTSKAPHHEVKSDGHLILKIIEGDLPSVREEEGMSPILQLCSLMADCWNLDSTKRPNAARCKALMEWMPSAVPSASGSEVRSPQLLLKIGDMHRLQSRPDEALKSIQRALEIGRSTENQQMVAGAMLLLGNVYKDLSRLPEAETNFKGALELYEQEGDRTGMGTALIGLGNVYDTLSQNPKAETHYLRALDEFSQVNNDLGRANAMFGLGRIYKDQSKLVQAAENHQAAEEIYMRIGDEMGRANALLGLGRVRHAQSQLEDAEKKCEEAKEIYERIGGELGRANALETLGDVHQAQSLYPEAAACYTEAAEVYGKLKYENGRANALLGLARIHHLNSEFGEAEAGYKEVLDIYTGVGDELGRANTLNWLGDTYRMQSRHSDAEEAYVRADEAYVRTGDDVGRASVLIGLGQARQGQSKIEEAEAAYTTALEVSERVGNKGIYVFALMLLGIISGFRRDFGDAEKRYAEAVVILTELGVESALRSAEQALETYRKLAQETHPA